MSRPDDLRHIRRPMHGIRARSSADEYIAVIASAGASEDTTRPEAEVIHAL
jgi:hypothetical protein